MYRKSVRLERVELKYETTRLFSPMLWTGHATHYQRIELQQLHLRERLKENVLKKIEDQYFMSTTYNSHKNQGYDAWLEELIKRVKSNASGSLKFQDWIRLCAFTDFLDNQWDPKRDKPVARTTAFPYLVFFD